MLGSGANGTVCRAFDAELRRDVALKTLFDVSPDLAQRLKNEFRALHGITHPNLVQLYDLVIGEGESFFTMELVEGVDVVRHVRGAAEPRALLDHAGLERLWAVLPQLVDAVDALHAAGRVHRDLKPSNVLVTRDGRAMVLDFGLVATVRDDAGGDDREMGGTLAYMAPEQVWGVPPSAAVDWYALGGVLFEVLTGMPAFSGTPVGMLRVKERGPVPGPCDLAPATSAGLDALVRALLDPDPTRRPDGRSIRSALEGGAVAPMARTWRHRDAFVGRATELATLAEWLREVSPGHPRVGHVVGPSGIGKSALLRSFGERAAATALVLSGRCHAHETVPYKALDGVMEGLARHLGREDAALPDLGAGDLGPLLDLFPVLSSVGRFARAGRAGGEASPRELQRRAFAALRTLVAELARRRPIVLSIDDVQWGDRDSALALLEVLRGPDAPAVLLLLSSRIGETEGSGFLQELERGDRGPDHTLVVEPLGGSDTRELAADLLGCDAADPIVERVVNQAGGSPFFVEQLSRYHHEASRREADVDLDRAILGRIDAIGSGARALAELVAVAGGALDLAQVIDLTGSRDPAALCYRMREQCMLRTVATRPKSVEVYHDRIRETLLAALGAERRRSIHRQVADALQGQASPDPEAVLEHLLGAGDERGAADAAIAAAERSAGALAFGRAAELYEIALRLRDRGAADWTVMARHAEALANAGLGSAAGAASEAAANASARAQAPAARTLALRAAATRELLCAGDVEAGRRALRRTLALARIPYPRSPATAVARLLTARARIAIRGFGFTPRAEDTIDPDRLAQVDACWAATIGLNAFDAVRSAAFQARHSLLALDAGEPGRVVRALTAEAVYRAAEGGRTGRTRAAALAARVDVLATSVGDPRARAFARLCAGVGSYFGGSWERAIDELAEAERIFRGLHGVAWELANCRSYRLWALSWNGDTARFEAEVEAAATEARTRGDVPAEIGAASGHANLAWLLADRPAEARSRAAAAVGRLRLRAFQSPHYADLLAQTRIDLYEGDGGAAWKRVSSALPHVRRSHLLRLQLFRIEVRVLIASSALAAATAPAAGRERRRLLAAAARAAAQLRAEDMRLGQALGDALTGMLMAAEGGAESAARCLRAAALLLARCGLPLYAESALLNAAALDGASAPPTPSLGVAPANVAAMLLPGLTARRSMLKVA